MPARVSPNSAPAKPVIDAEAIARTVTRLAHQILEHTTGGLPPVLLGIPTRGTPLAARIAERMHQLSGAPVFAGSLDVSAYRDDAALRGTKPPQDSVLPDGGVDGAHVV